MKTIKQLGSLLLTLALLCAMIGCTNQIPVELDSVKTFFKDIGSAYPGVKDMKLYFFPTNYHIDIRLSPFKEEVMYQIMEQLCELSATDAFTEEYITEAEKETPPEYKDGKLPGLSVQFIESGMPWEEGTDKFSFFGRYHANPHSATQDLEDCILYNHFAWRGNQSHTELIISGKELKEIFENND